MESKLIRYLDGVMEAIWLVTIITIPLFFNVYSNRIFEPDKIALLRIFSSTALAVWIVKIIAYGSVTNFPRKGFGAYISSILRIPIIIPILVFLIVSIIATTFSIAPRTSLWGSYQRLQGLYTTFSYAILFFVLVANLNSRKQIDRIITVIAMTSLPVALYGIIQKYGLDPVPWEGDVTVRIASSMGNSIFVAGFLIMAFPVTIIRIYENFRALMKIEEGVLKYILRASVYVTVACTQVIAIFLSGSRGPMIGLLMSILFISILLLIRIKNKAILVSFLVVGLFLGGFLILLNIESGPLEGVRNSPLIGRFGKLLDPESNSALVRKYIWQGAVELISPHAPLVFPDGTEDRLNRLRPIIGYGPETMFVAFNRFYNPELGSVEKRNASPDRAHNESWDMVVTTGMLGLIAYLSLFSLIFYYSLKWLSLINTRKDKYIFFSLYLGSGIASGLIVSLWRESAYLGIGLPVGFVIGLFLYLIYFALVTSSKVERSSVNWIAYIILASLFSAIIAHFIEINFGISIAATRTYFWIYVGLILIIGYKFQENEEFWTEILNNRNFQTIDNHSGLVNYKQDDRRSSGNFRSRKVENKPLNFSITIMWINEALIYTLLLSVTLCILGYDLISNQGEHSSSIKILWASLTEIDRGNSIGILLLLLTTWLLTGVVYSLEITVVNINEIIRRNTQLIAVAFVLMVSAIISSIFVFWHTSGLSDLVFEQINSIDQLFGQVSRYEFLITRVVIYLLVIIFSLGYVLAIKPILNKKSKKNNSIVGFVTAVILIPAFLAVALYLNLRIIQADIVYRLGNAFSQPGQWSVAVEVYKRSIDLMPGEDHYYLSLASAYFEQSKVLNDVQERERLIKQAESDLIKAQMINPLNTDHTANLARLYNLWSSFTENPELKQSRLLKSSEYYQLALLLSPNNTRLWNEWALLNLYGFRDSSEALRLLDHSLSIDPEYDWTHGLLGDYYVQQADLIEDEEQKRLLLEKANREYSQALANVKYYEAQYRFSYLRAQGAVYVKLGRLEEAILAYEKAINLKSAIDIWRIEDTLARLYFEIGEPEKAINYAQSAYDKAPESYKDRLLQLINFINSNRQ